MSDQEKEFWQMAYLIAMHKTGFNHDAKTMAEKALADFREMKNANTNT